MDKNNITNEIKRLIEKRTLEALSKNLPEKMVSIAKNLGKPIVSNGLFGSPLNDPFSQTSDGWVYDTSTILDVDENYNSNEIGYYFDGLRYGINLCITVMTENPMFSDNYSNDKVNEIKATYNGYLVFTQVEGEIKAYAPFPAWEDQFNMFFESSLIIEKKRKKELEEELIRENKLKYQSLWSKLKNLFNY